eukprot:524979_1
MAILSVLEDLFAGGYLSQNQAQKLTGQLIDAIIGDSDIFNVANDTANDTIDGGDFIRLLSTIASVTANPDLISINTTKDLADNFLSNSLNAMDLFISQPNNDSIVDTLYVIGSEQLRVIDNLDSSLATIQIS